MAIDVYQEITNRIIAELEKGEIPWQKPWIGGTECAYSYSTGKPYSLVNQILLGGSGEYITFMECKKLGGHVKKGEKGHAVMSWAKVKVGEWEDEDGNKHDNIVPMPKLYTVFEIATQCEGITGKQSTEAPQTFANNPIEAAEDIIKLYFNRETCKLRVEEGSTQAYYSPLMDKVVVPSIIQFPEVEEYYSTAFHEMTHSTGHSSRLNRLSTGKDAAFGGSEYSKEELVAELGAATLCNMVGIETSKTFSNSAAYIQGWLKALKDDKKLIVQASARADKAINYIMTGAAN